ncbi:MAG: ATP-dependent Clp protease adaptor ClpS [Agathobacter sp.]|jgi:ATP-dependent Clp protease adaptor protein ClpS|nr:ATP-dependent Clp protease adaptor ClpS [Agathobacter sp.]
MSKIQEVIDTQDTITDNSEYNVIIFNDDITPMEYVVIVLATIFGYDMERAIHCMMNIHTSGQGVVCTTTLEDAYAKLDRIEAMNNEYGQLLQADVQKV